MEVHHHPDLHHKPKKWKQYFLEFLMLFLAVTMGFFAENIREHYTEKENAKRYLETYRDELLQHREQFNVYKTIFQKKIIICDSIKTIYFNAEENQKLEILRRLLVPGLTLTEIPFNTSSYDQMVNSGALRFIKDVRLRDSMAAYKGLIETTKTYNLRLLQSMVNNTFEISKLIDFHDVVSTDTSMSYNNVQHIPAMNKFPPLSREQRGTILFFYESYIVQAQSDLRRIRNLYISNQDLLKMVNDQLEK